MKSTKSLLSGILVLIFGIVLIICHKMITGQGIIVLAGILFLVTGVINIVLYVNRKDKDNDDDDDDDDKNKKKKKKDERPRLSGPALFISWLVSIAAIILGLCMLVFESTFTQMIPLIFGLLVFLGGIMLAFTMGISLRRLVKMPGWMWSFPAIMAVMAIIIASLSTPKSDPVIMLLTGISLMLFGVAGMITGIIATHARRAAARAEQSVGVEDVEIKEIEQ